MDTRWRFSCQPKVKDFFSKVISKDCKEEYSDVDALLEVIVSIFSNICVEQVRHHSDDFLFVCGTELPVLVRP